VIVDDKTLSSLSIRERAKRIAYVPQTHTATFAFPTETVVLMGRTAHGNVFSRPTSTDRAVAAAASTNRLPASDARDARARGIGTWCPVHDT